MSEHTTYKGSSLQQIVNSGRSIVPRGWAPLIKGAARLIPALQNYQIPLANRLTMTIDLRYSMSFEYFFNGEQSYERGTLRLLDYVLQDGDTFIDVGANLGYYSIIASQLVGESGTVVAFEPLPAASRVLHLNAHNCANLLVIQKAVGDQVGRYEFKVDDARSTLQVTSASANVIEVDVTTLDERLNHLARIDFIKIDVEGFELEVLRGARDIIATHQPILYFELLKSWSQKRGISFVDFADFLEPLGYQPKWINHDLTSNTLVMPEGQSSNYVVAFPPSKRHLLK